MPRDNQICVRDANRLSARIFKRHADATAARNVDKCRNADVEKVFNSRRRYDRGRAVQRLAIDCQRDGNRFNRSTRRDFDIAAEAGEIARPALVRQTAKGHNARALSMHNAGRSGYRRFGQRQILTSRNRYRIGVRKLCHKVLLSSKNGGTHSPRRQLQNQHTGAEQSGRAGQLHVMQF